MIKQKKMDWKDSNLEFVGSDIDRGVKKDAAKTEPAWHKVANLSGPGIFIWRIENFKVVEWPKDQYGKFYSGDSYIVLNAYNISGSPELLYDLHFWIGMHSTQDEYGTAAYKTVELDTFLDDKPIQHREVERHESALFKSYFPSLTYLKGGCPSGFRHVETKEYKPRLFHFSGDKKATIVIKEVKASKNKLDSGDVYILDIGGMAYQWNGSASSKDERFRAAQYLRELASDRHGKTKTEVIDEGATGSSGEFYSALSDVKTKKSYKADSQSTKHEKMLYKLSDETGSLEFSNVAKSSFDHSSINEEDVYIIDNGETIFVYVGEGASHAERKNALAYAHKYLQSTAYAYAPVTVVNKNVTGHNKSAFDAVLNAA